MSYLALTVFAALSLAAALFLLALARWWSPPPAEGGQRLRRGARLPLDPYRVFFYVLFGEVVLVLLCAWAIHFRAGWAQGRGYLAEMGLFVLVVFVGLFYLWRKEGRA